MGVSRARTEVATSTAVIRPLLVLAALAPLGACAVDDTPDPSPASAPTARAAAARAVGLATLDGDVALICGPAPRGATDHPDATPDCDAARVEADGTLAPLGRGGLLAAARLDAAHLLLHTAERTLVLREVDAVAPDAVERVIARDVADPRVAADGTRRVVFTQLPAGAEIAPSTTGTLVLLDLDRGTRRVVTAHPQDSAPFVVPGGDDVLFVSARTSLASLYVASPGRAARQVTNRGRRAVDDGFVPVPGRELAWLPGAARVAVFTASYGGAHALWAVDIDTGDAARLGAGRYPTADGAGVVAIDADGAPVRFAARDVATRLRGAR